MAVFDPDSPWSHPLDYQLAASGFVNLYFSDEVLERHLTWLSSQGYKVIRLYAASWDGEQDMHQGLAAALDFPDYYGRNLNALNDCLGDVANCSYGLSQEETGLALVLVAFDSFMSKAPTVAHYLIDSYAHAARLASLVGHRMLCLAQSRDPDLSVPPVGATPVGWNHEEWLDSKRHPL